MVIATLLVLVIGFAALFAVLDHHLSRFREEQMQLSLYFREVFGDRSDGDAVTVLASLKGFLYKLEAGRVPALREDDWRPSMSDRDRIRKADELRLEEEHWLG